MKCNTFKFLKRHFKAYHNYSQRGIKHASEQVIVEEKALNKGKQRDKRTQKYFLKSRPSMVKTTLMIRPHYVSWFQCQLQRSPKLAYAVF